MKNVFMLIILGISHWLLGAELDTNTIALGDWSAPVSNRHGLAIRGRFMICEYPRHRGPVGGLDSALYLELQEYSDFVNGTGEVYWDPNGLVCELRDASGKSVPESPSGYGGPAPYPCWITLPSYSSMRLRASPYAGGRLKDGGFEIWSARFQVWTIRPGDTNSYFLSGAFTVNPPTNHVPADFRYVWQGTLTLPAMRVAFAEQQSPQPTNAPHASLVAYPNAVISTNDRASGIKVSVEPNGRELKAIGKDGTVLWMVDLIKQWGTPKVGAPVIRYLSLDGGKVSVIIGKHMGGEVDLKTGKPRLIGED